MSVREAGGANSADTEFTTLFNDIVAGQLCRSEATGDFTMLLVEIATACKWISNVVKRAELAGVIGEAGNINVQCESVQRLDVLSNKILLDLLKSSRKVAIAVSEENDEAVFFNSTSGAKYCVCFDPLDGSSNIDCGVSIGTIFGIYKINDETASLKDVLRPGTDMIAAGFCHYGSSTKIVLAFKDTMSASCYNYDPLIGEFVKTHSNMTMKSKKIFSINEGNYSEFPEPIKEYLDIVKGIKPHPNSKTKVNYSARYIGSMAGDLMRTILYGGVFIYPLPKLRVLYECFPMALIIECVGGRAFDGKGRMLEHIPKGIHVRSPIILGSKDEVLLIESLYKKYEKK